MTQQNPPAVRGFVIERQDGQAQLPGSLHTNRKLSQWLSLQTPGRIEILTGKAELGQGILTALRLMAAEELDVDLTQISLISASTLRGRESGPIKVLNATNSVWAEAAGWSPPAEAEDEDEGEEE